MGCRILFDRDSCRACLYDSVTETAFGPCFIADDADIEAENFCVWLDVDPRILPEALLRDAHTAWHRTHHDAEGDLIDGPVDDRALEVLAEVQQFEVDYQRRRALRRRFISP